MYVPLFSVPPCTIMIHDHHISFHQKKTVTLKMYQIRSSLGLNPMPDGAAYNALLNRWERKPLNIHQQPLHWDLICQFLDLPLCRR